jgi:nitroimidazol reductase NimA-like FMN-containing flavoprotein (pyridoxamine 5'-phosphate oxidase superfamily)
MKPMRRGEKKLSREIGEAIIDKCGFFVMATVGQGNEPYCVPLSMAREGEWLYFHSAREGHKIDNLRANNKVCVSCVGDTSIAPGEFSLHYESAIIFGTAEEINADDEKIHALRVISQHWTPDIMGDFDKVIEKSLNVTAVWKIHIDEISAKGRFFDHKE